MGKWAFPGGFVEHGETVENTAVREVLEETSIKTKLIGILGVYSDPSRDPRDHLVSIVFVGSLVDGEPKGGDDAAEARWFDIDSINPDDLAFDHATILADLKHWLNNEGRTFWSTKSR